MVGYLVSLSAFGCFYALLGLGLNLQWGHTGVVNLGFVAFFAIGAYTSALLTLRGAPIVTGLLAGMAVASAAAYPIGKVCLRLSGDYLAIVTLGFAQVVQALITNAGWAGGGNGLVGLPFLFGRVSPSLQTYFQLGLFVVVTGVVIALLYRLTESPYGRLLRAIRSNLRAAAGLGKDVDRYRLVTFVIGSSIAGLTGGLYAHYIGYVSPSQFDSSIVLLVLTGVAVGGSSHWGAALGTLLFVALEQTLAFLGSLNALPLNADQVAQIELAVVGVVLILFMQRRPQGIWPYRPSRAKAE